MKDSIGLYGITTIVIVFIFFFAGYLSMSVNQTKAYNVKNEVINIIEKHTGIDSNTISEINEYLADQGYRTQGSCKGLGYALNADDTSIDNLEKDKDGILCIRPFNGTGAESSMTDTYNQFPTTRYYKITVFYSLDVPGINQILHFTLTGSTKTIYYPIECPESGTANECKLKTYSSN